MSLPDPATDTYTRFILPSALHGISPALSASLAARSAPTLDRCHKCGTFILDGSGQVRSSRSKRKATDTPAPRSLHITCGSCGHLHPVPIHSPCLSHFPTAKKARRAHINSQHVLKESPLSPHPRLSPTPSASCAPQISAEQVNSLKPHVPSPAPAVNKPRTKKKKPGLQEMLARNRERQEQERAANDKAAGLAAFLQGI